MATLLTYANWISERLTLDRLTAAAAGFVVGVASIATGVHSFLLPLDRVPGFLAVVGRQALVKVIDDAGNPQSPVGEDILLANQLLQAEAKINDLEAIIAGLLQDRFIDQREIFLKINESFRLNSTTIIEYLAPTKFNRRDQCLIRLNNMSPITLDLNQERHFDLQSLPIRITVLRCDHDSAFLRITNN